MAFTHVLCSARPGSSAVIEVVLFNEVSDVQCVMTGFIRNDWLVLPCRVSK